MEGNIEFLGYFKKYEEGALTINDELIDAVVTEAHSLQEITMRIGFFPNMGKSNIMAVLKMAAHICKEEGIEVFLPDDLEIRCTCTST